MTKTDTITNAAITNALEFHVTFAATGKPPQNIEAFSTNLNRLTKLSSEKWTAVGGQYSFVQGVLAGTIIGAAIQREPVGADLSEFVRQVIDEQVAELRDWADDELKAAVAK